MGVSCVMVWIALQAVEVREEAVTELSKHIKEAQSLQDLRQADAVSPPIAFQWLNGFCMQARSGSIDSSTC